MKIKETINVTVDKFYCDICLSKKIRTKSNKSCLICEKDICLDHMIFDKRDYTTDYPKIYCKQCWEIGQPFIKEISILELKLNEEIKRINDMWVAKTLK